MIIGIGNLVQTLQPAAVKIENESVLLVRLMRYVLMKIQWAILLAR